jgi:hypothetical protein
LVEEPTTYEMAKIESKWHKIMDEELHALENKSNLGGLLFTKK